MAPSLLETLSTTRLALTLSGSGVVLLMAAWLGAYVAPDPMGHQSNLMRFCDTAGMKSNQLVDSQTCAHRELSNIAESVQRKTEAHDLVMWTQFPHANSGLSMSKWFQFMAASMMVELDEDSEHQYHPQSKLTFEATLAYKHKLNDSEWTVMAESLQEWDFTCKREHNSWNCEQINFFELGSCHHATYLVNLRLPTYKGKNRRIGTLYDIWITEIHQNGGFTKVLLGVRTFFFHMTAILFSFYLRRVYKSGSSVTLLQKAVGALGFSVLLLNAPVEFISLFKDVPGLLLWSDIRQGAFYAFLVLFLIVFMGEHSADKGETTWKSYKYPIFFTAITSGCLLVFDLSERGRQLWDPFHSVWSNDNSRWWGMFFISSALFMLCLDVLYLFYLTFTAIKSLRAKIFSLHSMTESRRMQYKFTLRRVVGVCSATLLVAVLSITLFAIMHFSEVSMKWDEVKTANMNSGAYLSIYALANLYALNLLLLYSPADKESDDFDDVAEEKKNLVANGPTVFQLATKENQD
eukprot:scpid24281/ scgid22839/ Protein wntless homolog; Integral membrane protein GPR177